MAFGPELVARLRLDATAFSRSLAKVNGQIEGLKQLAKVGDLGGSIKQALGAGAIIQGFRAVLQHAQEARDRAAEFNKKVDDGTASVARYADQWDKLKQGVVNAGIAAVGFFTQVGEKAGNFLNDQVVSKFRGMTPDQAKRTREISEKAEANADRLSTPEALAAAKARGEGKKKERDEAAKKRAQELIDVQKQGGEQWEKNQLKTLTIDEQIAALEKKRAEAMAARGGNSEMGRAKARLEQYKLEEQIAEKRAEREKMITEHYEAQAKALIEQGAEEQRLYESKARSILTLAKQQNDAEKSVKESRASLFDARHDRLGLSLGDAAKSKNTTIKSKARQIASLESRAARIFQGGGEWRDEKGNVMSAEERAQQLRGKADALRKGSGFLSTSEQDPLKAQTDAVINSEEHLKVIKDALTQELSMGK